MMKVIQICLLWLAAFTLLAHSIVPHHHHSSIKQACEIELHNQCNHNHANESHDHESDDQPFNCFNHEQEHEDACSLNVNTFIEHQHNVLFAVLNKNQLHAIPESQTIRYFIDFSGKIKHCLFRQIHERAPPAIS